MIKRLPVFRTQPELDCLIFRLRTLVQAVHFSDCHARLLVYLERTDNTRFRLFGCAVLRFSGSTPARTGVHCFVPLFTSHDFVFFRTERSVSSPGKGAALDQRIHIKPRAADDDGYHVPRKNILRSRICEFDIPGYRKNASLPVFAHQIGGVGCPAFLQWSAWPFRMSIYLYSCMESAGNDLGMQFFASATESAVFAACGRSADADQSIIHEVSSLPTG